MSFRRLHLPPFLLRQLPSPLPWRSQWIDAKPFFKPGKRFNTYR